MKQKISKSEFSPKQKILRMMKKYNIKFKDFKYVKGLEEKIEALKSTNKDCEGTIGELQNNAQKLERINMQYEDALKKRKKLKEDASKGLINIVSEKSCKTCDIENREVPRLFITCRGAAMKGDECFSCELQPNLKNNYMPVKLEEVQGGVK